MNEQESKTHRGVQWPGRMGLGAFRLAGYHPPWSLTWSWVLFLEPRLWRFTWWRNNGYGRFEIGPLSLLTQETMRC